MAAAVPMTAASRVCDVAAQIERVPQLDDRVGDDLARPVEGHVAAPIDPDELRPDLPQPLRRGDHVRRIAAPPDRVDREVLDEQQPVADAASAALVGQLVLELPGRAVVHGPQVVDGQHATVGREERMLVARRPEGHVAAGGRRGRSGAGAREGRALMSRIR